MKIAIVDDHAMVRSGIAAVLMASMDDLEEIIEAGGSQELLESALNPSELDLILLDYHLPGSIAAENLTVLASRFEKARILLLSSDENPHNITEMIHLGAAGYMVKSSKMEILVPTIRYVLAGGTYLPTTLLETVSKVEHSSPTDNSLSLLTLRQRQVFQHLLQGYPNKVIASYLNISESTVKTHVMAAFKVLGIESRTEAIAKFKKDRVG